METTTNLGLELTGTSTDDLERKARDWRLGIAGTDNSNFHKIDNFAGEVRENISILDSFAEDTAKSMDELISWVGKETTAVRYGTDTPSSEEDVRRLCCSSISKVTVPAGRYVIVTEKEAKYIRDRNLLDNKDSFNEERLDKYYVYSYKTVCTIPMEFTVYF